MWKFIRENRPFFVPYFFVLIIVGFLQLVYDKTQLFLFINTHANVGADFFFRYLTNVGDGLFYAVIIIVLLFVQYRYALAAVLSFALTSLAAQLLKHLVFSSSLRPKGFYEHSEVTLRVIEGVKVYTNNSFPSGHATTAFSVACLLSLLIKQKKWGYFFFFLACFTSYSRVYLEQHFVEDVYFGSILGVLLTLLLTNWLFRYLENNPKPWHEGKLKFRTRSK
ncbi:MAG: phosphatase PAP2 family protein [Bacteroidota bacterium]